ncbi:SDR family oxidoreductase [Rhodococcus sp. X156]|uniref:SDR family oxidoreductase n=1 Tax=Rhodococcus sp. X156 TaxID=2499145 RepID=UPI000FDC948E|nr:SDR family oxidoreductase [Rhodococcus sp. X156]
MTHTSTRTVAVTGSASGIGAACVARLRAAGHRTIGVDVQPGADVVADLATAQGRAAAVEAVTTQCGGVLDGLVACAGVGPLSDRPGSVLASVNYFGVVEVVQGLRPTLLAAQHPAVVAVSSSSSSTQPGIPLELVQACLAGSEGDACARAEELGALGTYPATKLALAWWIRTQAPTAEWIGAGIRLNAVAPGTIDTPMTGGPDLDPELVKLLDVYPVPLGRRGRPEEVASVIEFLLDERSSLLCGTVVFTDGGTDALIRGRDWPAPWQPSREELVAKLQLPS